MRTSPQARSLVGIDEAGYGPTLGPLLIAATRFEDSAPLAEAGEEDLWLRLKGAVRADKKGPPRALWVYDSKSLKAARQGMAEMESSVLAFALQLGSWPETLADLLELLGQPLSVFAGLPWYEKIAARKLPCWAWRQDVTEKAAVLSRKLAEAGLALRSMQARVFSARAFNEGVARTDDKASYHLENIAALISGQLAGSAPTQDLWIDCDKLGGRDSYEPMLGALFPETRIEILEQGRNGSSYRVQEKARRVSLRFAPKADQKRLPVALSSLICKLLRELFVDELNQWFLARRPGLAPTAGYPQDAVRFLAEIQGIELGVPRSDLVRSR